MKAPVILLILKWLSTSFAATPIYLGYQDSFGQYTFGYSSPESARSEVRSADGSTRGSFSYIDGSGNIQIAQYEADDGGFRIAATNLPQAPKPVEDTPEVLAAKMNHLKALELVAQRAEEERYSQMGAIHLGDKIVGPSEVIIESSGSRALGSNGQEASARVKQQSHAPVLQRDGITSVNTGNLMTGSADLQRLQQNMLMMPSGLTMSGAGQNQEAINNYSQLQHLQRSGTTPSHTILMKSDEIREQTSRAKQEQKITNRIAPKMGNENKDAKITNKIAPKEDNVEPAPALRGTIRANELHGPIRGSVFAPINVVPLGYPYSYGLARLPFQYGSYNTP